MDLSRFFSSRVKAEVFRLLFGPRTQELHAREIARRAQLNEATVRQELKKLTDMGIIEARRDANRVYYRARTDHQLYPEIRSIVLKTSGLAEILRSALENADVRTAFVFGSLASGEEKTSSDVDLMVIGSVSLREVSKLLLGVAERVSREINSHVMDEEEFARRREARDRFLSTILRAPKLFVIGDEHELAKLGR